MAQLRTSNFSLLAGRANRVVAVAASCLFGLLVSNAHAQNLVVNGGFESGNFSGWTVSDGSLTTAGNDQPHSGSFEARLGNRGLSTLSQSIATVVGTIYTVDLFVARQGLLAGGEASSFSGSFAGTTFLTLNALTLPLNSPYREFSATITATSTNSLLAFNYIDQPSYTLVDDVSVTGPIVRAVPEPETYALMMFGLGTIGLISRRRKRV